MGHKNTPISDFYRALLQHLHTLPKPPYVLALGTISISSPLDNFSLAAYLLVAVVWLLAHGAYKEFVTLGETFEKAAEGISWTVYRVGHLSDKPGVGDGRAGYVAQDGWTVSTPKTDVAGWLVREVEAKKWVGKMPALYSGVEERKIL